MAGPTVTLNMTANPDALLRAMDKAGKQAGQMGQRFDSAGKEVTHLDARMRNVEGTADDFETRAEGVGYAVSGLTDLMGYNASSTVMTATAFADLAGGAKRLGPELVAVTAKMQAMSAAQLAVRGAAIGAAVGLAALLLANRNNTEEAEQAVETWGDYKTTIGEARAEMEKYAGASKNAGATTRELWERREEIRTQQKASKEAEKLFADTLEDGNFALAKQIALDQDSAAVKADMLQRVEEAIQRERDIAGLRKENEAMVKGVTLAEQDLSDALQDEADAQDELADATKKRDDAQASLDDAVASQKDAQKELNDLLATGADGLTDYEEAVQRVAAADRAVSDAERLVAEALRDVEAKARAVESANRDVEAATKKVADAQAQVLTATERVATAEERIAEVRRKAADDAKDATLGIAKAANDQAKAQTQLARAEQRLAQLRLGAETTAAGLRDAEQDVADARVDLESATRAGEKANEDLADANGTLAGTSDDARDADEQRTKAVTDLNTALGNVATAEQGLLQAKDSVVTAEGEKKVAVDALASAEAALRDRIAERTTKQAEARALDDTDVQFADKVREAKAKVAEADRAVRDARNEVATATSAVQAALAAEQGAADVAKGKMRDLAGSTDSLWAARDRLIKQKPNLAGLFDLAAGGAGVDAQAANFGAGTIGASLTGGLLGHGLPVTPAPAGGFNIGSVTIVAQGASAPEVVDELVWLQRSHGR